MHPLLLVLLMLAAGGAMGQALARFNGSPEPFATGLRERGTTEMDTSIEEEWPAVHREQGHDRPSKPVNDTLGPGQIATLSIAVFLMGLVIITGNILVIIAVRTHKKLQTVSNVFVVNLSVCDLLFLTLVLPFNMYSYLEDGWNLDQHLCQLVGFTGYALTGTTLLNITLIAWNRYKLVTDMANYKTIFTQRNIFIMIFATWVLPVICLIPPALELWGKFGYVTMLVTCNLLLSKESQSFKIFLLVVRALVPCMLIAYFYLVIYRVTQASHQKIQRNVSNPSSYRLHMQKHSTQLTQTLYMVFLVFVVSYFPCAITGFIDWNFVLSKNYHMFCEITIYIGSALNPIIYGLMTNQFRNAYLNLLLGPDWKLHRKSKIFFKKLSPKRLSFEMDQFRGSHRKGGIAERKEAIYQTNQPLPLGRKTGVAPVNKHFQKVCHKGLTDIATQLQE